MLIQSTFKPAWWLNNPHLQTIYPSLFRKLPHLTDTYRERLSTPDQDFIDLDWCGKNTQQPIVILLHGLTGSSRSGYIQGLQYQLAQLGWRSVAMNHRGCSGVYNDSARCYHSGDTRDLDFVYQTLRAREPRIPLAAVGFSLGGNILLKWLGERQQTLTLFAATAVSVPLLLNLCASKLDNGFSKVYRRQLLRELKTYIYAKKRHLLDLNKAQEAEKLAQLGDLEDVNSFWQYDDKVIAKLYQFKDVHDYYQRSSSRQFLQHIAVPTLIIQAKDDPFMTPDVLPKAEELSATVQLEVANAGGHVGFVAGYKPWQPKYWLEDRIVEFLSLHLQKVS